MNIKRRSTSGKDFLLPILQERCFEIRYEDIAQNAVSVLPDMFNFLGEKFENKVLRFNDVAHDVAHDEGAEDCRVASTKEFLPSLNNYRKWSPEQLQGALDEIETLFSDLGYSV